MRHVVTLVGQHGATRSSRRARLARHVFRGVATGWTGCTEVVPEIDAHPEHKTLNLYMQDCCFFIVDHVGTSTARHIRHDARDTHDTSFMSCRVETCRDVTSQLEFQLYTIAHVLFGYQSVVAGRTSALPFVLFAVNSFSQLPLYYSFHLKFLNLHVSLVFKALLYTLCTIF